MMDTKSMQALLVVFTVAGAEKLFMGEMILSPLCK